MKKRLNVFIGIYLGIFLTMALAIVSHSCKAQLLPFGDCCAQALDIQKQNDELKKKNGELTIRISRFQVTLDSTRTVSDRVIQQTDDRIADLSKLASDQLAAKDATIGGLESEVATFTPIREERDKLKGRTWAGRTLRKARDGLAIVGGGTILIFTLKTLL